ncbi:hypothetical protein ACFL27_11525 [candidate division CSSED10-310 bacterium]|uniref:Outer membrane protein beta-barrel domain-containing protein n=1 Tax=candidate division CSSED10-310 bacterium TaxID=2855610 RepID=A0ABV6YXB6_UNCC1
MKSHLLFMTILLTIFLSSLPVAAYEFDQFGAGAYLSFGVPFGWFSNVNLAANINAGAHLTYSLERIVPNLVARTTIGYQSFHGDRYGDYKYKFRDLSIYAHALYFYDLGMPFKPYILAGLGVDFTTVSWDYSGTYHTSGEDTAVGQGITFGGGITVKTMDLLALFGEANIQTSTWAKGPDFGDIVFNALIGCTFYFYL